MRYPIIGAHIREHEKTTMESIRSPDPYEIIKWLGRFIENLNRHEVLFDHDYSSENDE